MKLKIEESNLIRLMKDRIDSAEDADIIASFAEAILGVDPGYISYDVDKDAYVVDIKGGKPEHYGFPNDRSLKEYNIAVEVNI
jgi:hypothetical protein